MMSISSIIRRHFLFLLICLFFVGSVPYASADAKQDVIDSLEATQASLQTDFSRLEARVNALKLEGDRKKAVDTAMDTVRRQKDDFLKLEPKNLVTQIDGQWYPAPEFTSSESAARSALHEVNKLLVLPVMPGATGSASQDGSVPKGDLMETFFPSAIRLLMRFASLMVLIAFIVSGVLMVIAFDNEERVTKAKTILYYTIIGFAAVLLAFAIAKAVTDIDFFDFI
jgi:hypothetical protein